MDEKSQVTYRGITGPEESAFRVRLSLPFIPSKWSAEFDQFQGESSTEKAPLQRIVSILNLFNSMACKTSIESSNDSSPAIESSCLLSIT